MVDWTHDISKTWSALHLSFSFAKEIGRFFSDILILQMTGDSSLLSEVRGGCVYVCVWPTFLPPPQWWLLGQTPASPPWPWLRAWMDWCDRATPKTIKVYILQSKTHEPVRTGHFGKQHSQITDFVFQCLHSTSVSLPDFPPGFTDSLWHACLTNPELLLAGVAHTVVS